MTKILLADDHQLLIDGMQSLLAGQPSLEIVGVAKNGVEAARLAGSPVLASGGMTTRYLNDFAYQPARIDVLQGGTQTTVQDYPGRTGYWDIGVPPSGPMDDLAFRYGNRLLDNPPELALSAVTDDMQEIAREVGVSQPYIFRLFGTKKELFMEAVDEFDLIIFDRYRRRGVLPNAYIENVARYVRDGGNLISEACPGRIDAHGYARRGELSPTLAELFGVRQRSLTMVAEPESSRGSASARWSPTPRTWGENRCFAPTGAVAPLGEGPPTPRNGSTATASTMIPMPPNHCVSCRQNRIPGAACSKSATAGSTSAAISTSLMYGSRAAARRAASSRRGTISAGPWRPGKARITSPSVISRMNLATRPW